MNVWGVIMSKEITLKFKEVYLHKEAREEENHMIQYYGWLARSTKSR